MLRHVEAQRRASTRKRNAQTQFFFLVDGVDVPRLLSGPLTSLQSAQIEGSDCKTAITYNRICRPSRYGDNTARRRGASRGETHAKPTPTADFMDEATINVL